MNAGGCVEVGTGVELLSDLVGHGDAGDGIVIPKDQGLRSRDGLGAFGDAAFGNETSILIRRQTTPLISSLRSKRRGFTSRRAPAIYSIVVRCRVNGPHGSQ